MSAQPQPQPRTYADALLDDPYVIDAIAYGLKPGQAVIDLIAKVRRAVEAADALLPPSAKACKTCGYSGWYGSRRHDPKYYSPHLHCDCGRPCQACASGDGFIQEETP